MNTLKKYLVVSCCLGLSFVSVKAEDAKKTNEPKGSTMNTSTLSPEAEGKAFLEKNKTDKDVKVTSSGLQYKVVKKGTGAHPKSTDTVRVHYKGVLINGTEFDSSYKRNAPAEFPLNRVISGWTEGLQIMEEGATYKFYIPAALAYGNRALPGIPANSTLIFDVELIKILK